VANNTANLRSRILGGGGGRATETGGTPDTEELANQSGKPAPRSQDQFANRPHISKGDFNRSKPPKDRMRRYWRQFETTPLIREPITSFARQVVEPGYRVEAEVLSEDEIERIEQWLSNAAIVSGKSDRDVMKLLKKAAVQREVRGTALIEKVPAREDNDILYGVKLINAETVEVNTMPRQAMLLPPERPREIFADDPNVTVDDVPTTSDGLAAAYQQDVTTNRWRRNDEYTQYWTSEQIVPLTRDADVGEIFGTSRIESVSSRVEGLKKKLQDNDEAIASKAYPLWLFLFGSEEQPWERDDIDRFMNAHDMDNFQPGLKQGVRGDVSVKTISGEVADIAEYLQFDLDYILTAMPMPKYTLGAFESQINQFVSQSQERDIQRQLKEARREMESEFSEIVQEKSQEMFGLSDEDVDEVKFKMGRPNEQNEEVGPNQNVIDYRGKGNDGGNDTSGQNETGDGSGNQNQGQQNNDEQEQDGEQSDSDSPEDEEENIWTAELADPRFVGTNPQRRQLTSAIDSVFEGYVNNVVQRLRDQYRNAPRNAMTQIDTINTRASRSAMDSSDLRDVSPSVMEEVVRDTLTTLESDTQLDYTASYNTTHRNNTTQFSNNVMRATERAVNDLGDRISEHVTRGAQSGEEMQNIVERIKATFTRDKLRQRARLIAHMEMQSAVNTTKLIEFENHEDVVGVQPINTCGEGTTQVCQQLVGCGDGEPAIARFDSEESLSEQWTDAASGAYIYSGFDPLPQVPPWHFGCDTEIVPVVETEDGEELTHATPEEGSVFTLEKLEDKYGIEVENNG